jgi:hypothetical protein
MSFFKKIQQPTMESDAHHIMVGGKKLKFKLKYAKRKTLAILVSLDGDVIVKAPNKISLKNILHFVEDKSIWILTKQQEFSVHPQKMPENTFKFLGKNYKLKAELAIQNKVLLRDELLVVQTTETRNKEKIHAQVDAWYRAQAKKIFTKRMEICAEKACEIKVKFKGEVRLRKMKSRWGSCSSDGQITLNTELVSAPLSCIDYVILHELCHIREHNHSPAFYALMDKVMPNWEKTRKLLNQTVRIRNM